VGCLWLLDLRIVANIVVKVTAILVFIVVGVVKMKDAKKGIFAIWLCYCFKQSARCFFDCFADFRHYYYYPEEG